MIGAAILPAFLFAVLSSRANSRLIWGFTFFAFGESVAMNCWYTLSRASLQAFEADSSAGWGWAGKLALIHVIWPLAIGILLLIPWAALRRRWYGKLAGLLSLAWLGAAEGMLVWYAYSNCMITDAPRARSFAFFLPISFLGAFLLLWFCPRQPREKYQGLTLATLGQEILIKRKG